MTRTMTKILPGQLPSNQLHPWTATMVTHVLQLLKQVFISLFLLSWDHQWPSTHVLRALELSPQTSFSTHAHPAPTSSLSPTSAESPDLGALDSAHAQHAGGRSRTKKAEEGRARTLCQSSSWDTGLPLPSASDWTGPHTLASTVL